MTTRDVIVLLFGGGAGRLEQIRRKNDHAMLVQVSPNRNGVWNADFKKKVGQVELDCSVLSHVEALLAELLAHAKNSFEEEKKTECDCRVF